MSIKKKHKKNKREIKTRKSIISMTEKEQPSVPETTDTNHAEAVINQTEMANKEELINESLEPQTDQDAAPEMPVSTPVAPEAETEPEPVTVPVPTPVHSETTEDEQAKKLYDFYFGEQTQQNILESETETQTEEKIISDDIKEIEIIPEDDPEIEETANQLKENIENFKTFLPNPELLVPQQNRVVPPPKKFNPWLIGAIIGILIALICLCMLFFGNKERV